MSDRVLANITRADRLLDESRTVGDAIGVADIAESARIFAKRARMAQVEGGRR